ncbi:hypothetical protein RN001_009729 [Aquatica leii]|uniref:Uncharacterized protein n=1 Tax=Aquatica leii TaxID=1421715 RepID=A0AAN7P716_9COLE|nr:hypothetical protein RN001_009729 [Aquatica leii]
MELTIKCKTCRHIIFNNAECSSSLLNAHGINLINNSTDTCATIVDQKLLFIDEEHLPMWIVTRISSEHWSKGKLNCYQCNARIGAFDFISGTKCQCEQNVLPPVHIINSKVDFTRITKN